MRGHLVDAGLGTFIVPARRPGYTDRSNNLVAGPDRQATGDREHALYSLEPTEAGSLSIRLTKSADEVPKVRAV